MGPTLDRQGIYFQEAIAKLKCDVLCVFGLLDPSLVHILSGWLEQKKEHFAVFLEEDLTLFMHAKHSSLAENPQIRVLRYQKGEVESLKAIAWEFVFLKWGYFTSEGASSEVASDCFAQLEHYHQGIDLLASDYQDLGVKSLSNVINNLIFLPRSKLGFSLEGQCKDLTAVVCGAGPSLDRCIPFLRQIQDKVLIIAGGSAIKALHVHGITPHLMAGVDPDPSYIKVFKQENFASPFFYQSRFSHSLLSYLNGPLVWMPSQGHVPLESYALERCGIFSEPFDAGWSVANFATAIAVHLGCKKIVLAGVDFYAKKEQVYASGLPAEAHRGHLFELEQGSILSRKDWLMSAQWTCSLVAEHPLIDWQKAFPSSDDIFTLPSANYEDLISLPQRDMPAFIHALIEKAPFATSATEGIKEEIKKSFENSLHICAKLLSVWESCYPLSPLENPNYLLFLHDLEQEICYHHCLKPLWEVWRYSIVRTESHLLGKELHKLLFFKNVIETHLR